MGSPLGQPVGLEAIQQGGEKHKLFIRRLAHGGISYNMAIALL